MLEYVGVEMRKLIHMNTKLKNEKKCKIENVINILIS